MLPSDARPSDTEAHVHLDLYQLDNPVLDFRIQMHMYLAKFPNWMYMAYIHVREEFMTSATCSKNSANVYLTYC